MLKGTLVLYQILTYKSIYLLKLQLLLAHARSDPILQKDEVEEAIELESDFAQLAGSLKSETIEEAQGSRIF